MDKISILELTQACFNKVESEVHPNKYLNSDPNRTMRNLLVLKGFKSLYDFTLFLVDEYGLDLKLDEIFIYRDYEIVMKLNSYGTFVVKSEKRESLLSFFRSVIRDHQIKQLIN